QISSSSPKSWRSARRSPKPRRRRPDRMPRDRVADQARAAHIKQGPLEKRALPLPKERATRPLSDSGQHAVVVGADVAVLGLAQEDRTDDQRHDRNDDRVPQTVID